MRRKDTGPGGILNSEAKGPERSKVRTPARYDSYEHWRESDHDDLVLAAALACWGAAKRKGYVVVSRRGDIELHPPCPNAKRTQTRISSAVVSTVKTVVLVCRIF